MTKPQREALSGNNHLKKKYEQDIGIGMMEQINDDRGDSPITKNDRPLPVKLSKNDGTPSENDEGKYEKSVIEATEGKSSNT